MSVKRLISVVTAFCLFASQFSAFSAESWQFLFPVGKSSLDTLYSSNARAYARVCTALSGSAGKVTVTAYSSPDGKFSRNRQLARLRAASVQDFLSSVTSSEVSLVIVEEDWEGVKAYLKRSNKEWKQEALDIISTSGGDKKALLQDLWVGEAWDDLMKNCFPALRRVSVSIENSASEGPESPISGSAIVFNQSSSAIPSSAVSELKKVAASDASTLYIYVYASPEGTEEGNIKLSNKRATRLEALLRQYGYSGAVSLKVRGEDWNGLLEAVKNASDLPDKEAVIDILQDTGLDRNARKAALQKLSYGKTWLRLMDTEMKGLRRAVISSQMIL